MSLPKQYADIERPKSITVEYINEKNEIIKEKKNGFEAPVLQHEIDHLDGKVFLDRMTDLSQLAYVEEFEKYIADKKTLESEST